MREYYETISDLKQGLRKKHFSEKAIQEYSKVFEIQSKEAQKLGVSIQYVITTKKGIFKTDYFPDIEFVGEVDKSTQIRIRYAHQNLDKHTLAELIKIENDNRSI